MPAALPKLIVADTDSSADLLYATRFFAPDAFAFLQKGKQTRILLNSLEIDRARKEAKVDAVDALSDLETKNKKSTPQKYEELLLGWLKKHRVPAVEVPDYFPLGLADYLRDQGLRMKVRPGLFFPEREFKNADELKSIRRAIRITEAGMQRGFDILRESKIRRDKKLTFRGSPLTAEILRAEIDTTLLRLGGIPKDTIVACGNQACDPHERGSGILKANELIILDIFPRDTRSGYYGDLTRTVLRGRASDAQRKLWETCLAGQKKALAEMKPGRPGKSIHEGLVTFFKEEGYPTEIRKGRWQGFFHGTGHGLGLDLHESPRFAATNFKEGQVMTVEPGIYIPGLGGVRHEDDVLITKTGIRVLSKIGKPFEL
ncbi:MAG: M24 family metallopeptidase [Chthoniobacterales bacterium]